MTRREFTAALTAIFGTQKSETVLPTIESPPPLPEPFFEPHYHPDGTIGCVTNLSEAEADKRIQELMAKQALYPHISRSWDAGSPFFK